MHPVPTLGIAPADAEDPRSYHRAMSNRINTGDVRTRPSTSIAKATLEPVTPRTEMLLGRSTTDPCTGYTSSGKPRMSAYDGTTDLVEGTSTKRKPIAEHSMTNSSNMRQE